MKASTIAVLATTIGFASATSDLNERQDINLADIQALINNINAYEAVIADNAANLYISVTAVEAYGGEAGYELGDNWNNYLQYMELSFSMLQNIVTICNAAL